MKAMSWSAAYANEASVVVIAIGAFTAGREIVEQDDGFEERVSAGDLVMVSVLRRLNGSPLLNAFPNLSAYVARAEARPAFKRAFAAQLAVFEGRSAGA